MAEGRSADVLRSHRALDELIVVPRRWLKSGREVLALRRRLLATRFDVAIDVQGLSKSAIAARLSARAAADRVRRPRRARNQPLDEQ